MNHTHTAHIEAVLADIQARWGAHALQPLSNVNNKLITIPTGFPLLDTALSAGGIPKHRLTSLLGQATSGMTTLAYKIMAQAQVSQLVVVYLDAPHTFDPQYAALRGVDMELLLLVRPETWELALEMLRDLVGITVTGLLIFDTSVPTIQSPETGQSLAKTLERVGTLLPQSSWTVVTLVPDNLNVKVDGSAALRLHLKRLAWLYADVLYGYRVEVTVAKNKLGLVGEPIIIEMELEG